MFQTAKSTKIFENVVDQIQEAILEGRLKAGQTLPSERELKEIFNVSRGSLREALRVLENKGLIEIRLGVGGGSVVRAVDEGRISESLALLIRSQKVSLNHLAQFREDVEGIVAAHAAENRTPADIRHLNQLIERARECVDGGRKMRDQFIEADRQIHLSLARITQNPIYIFVLQSIHDNIHQYYDRFLSMEQKELAENYRDLCDMVRAVKDRDSDSARQVAQNHVERFNLYMKQRESFDRSRG
jgi:DNA-binding FadR family transcriptional regulator